MRCHACGAELVAGKPFCPACGTSVALACRSCGATLQPGFRFCPDCGTPVAASGQGPDPAPASPREDPLARLLRRMPAGLAHKVRAAQGAIEGERKVVTVLFCDLAGSTAIAEGLDPEEYRGLLERYLEVAFREIYRLEGIVNQLAGDGLMALFGAPVAHEDAPQRAVRAALGIQEALARLNEELRATRGLELRARIGVHTGPVVVGTVGNDLKMDYTAVGDTTNLAARLEALAGPGGILVSEATHRLVRGFFEVRAAGPFEVKGRREPVTAYAVLGYGSAETPLAVARARGLTPFVGRDEELAQLEACHARLSAGGAQVVSVVGEAGSGKSRLLYEFRERRAREGTVFLEGRCSSIRQAAPYHPFMAMFRQHFDLRAGEPTEVACAKVSARAHVDLDRLEQMYPRLFRFLCVSTGAEANLPADELKQESFDALARLVLAEAARAPVALLIEDLQWIDEPSRELLETLTGRLADARVLVLLSERPDSTTTWHTRSPFTRIVLRRLRDDHVAAIVRGVVGVPVPAELERRLVAKADGSPFFAEEMTRALLEDGSLVREGGEARLTRRVEEVPIPGTVQEVIAARLDRLPPPAKRVVQVAAVLGRQFSGAQLAELLAGEGIDVPRALGELEQRGLLHRKSARSADELRFGESLTQEVAYEGLLHRQRRQLHERVGLLLETAPEDGGAERWALLAYHFSRSDSRAKTVAALLEAARESERLPSWRAALDFYRRAWDVAEVGASEEAGGDGPFHRAVLQATRGLCRVSAIFGASDRAESERAGERGRALAEALQETEALAELCYFHGVITMLGEPDQFARGLALAEEGLAVAERAGLRVPTMMRIASGLAVNYVLDGRWELADRASGGVLAELEQEGHRDRPSDLYLGSCWIRASVLLQSDALDAAVALAAETHDRARRAPNRTVTGGAAVTLAQVHLLRGEYAEARRWADESLDVAEAIANLAMLPAAAAVALLARQALGEPIAGERHGDAIERGVAAGNSLQTNVRFVADALIAAGNPGRVERLLAALLANRAGGRLREAVLATAVGQLLAWSGRFAEAQRALARAMTLAETLGARTVFVAAVLADAELAVTRGERPPSQARLAQARAACQELCLGHYEPRVARLVDGDVRPASAGGWGGGVTAPRA
jgi:class 3 adenylate cyclase/tetratricopeptide (TPR) repeat protein